MSTESAVVLARSRDLRGYTFSPRFLLSFHATSVSALLLSWLHATLPRSLRFLVYPFVLEIHETYRESFLATEG